MLNRITAACAAATALFKILANADPPRKFGYLVAPLGSETEALPIVKVDGGFRTKAISNSLAPHPTSWLFPAESRASNLEHKRECPYCGHALTLKESIVISNGSGFEEWDKVRTRDGKLVMLRSVDVNPNLVEVLEQ